ncbi:fimbrial protein [Serratia fonticola]|nr:fimbrial protein [Serratia fonticola]
MLLPFCGSTLAQGAVDDYAFDPALLRSSVFNNVELSQFNPKDVITPGRYTVDLFTNGVFIERTLIRFIREENNQVSPCFERQQLLRLGMKAVPAGLDGHCLLPERDIHGVTARTDIAQLRLDLTVPQVLLTPKPRGSVEAADLHHGEPMVFTNYNVNQYHVSYRRSSFPDLNSTYASFNGGGNLGLWRYRQQSNYRYDNEAGSHWDTSRRYVQRAILPWRSEVLLGEGFTAGQFFAGLGFRGVQITSDERMLPDSWRGYAPTVRGVARTNARVTVLQGQNTLYETTVAPGPFVIDDLFATNFSGDLTVIVTEADGSASSFTVPFAAVPQSIRPGFSRYSATVGRLRYLEDSDVFSEVIWQQGVSNALTLNAGNQLADGYQAFMLGGVYSHPLGAFGMDTTYSQARLPDGSANGWMFHLSYSKTFSPTNTTVSIAGYRYSTAGFLALSDVLGVRQTTQDNQYWQSDTYRQQSRFDLSVNQGMGKMGNLMLSGSTQDYRHGRGRDNQLQLGWGKIVGNGIALNLSLTRTRRLGEANPAYYNDSQLVGNVVVAPFDSSSQTVTSLSVSFPLGRHSTAPTASMFTNHSQGQGGNYQTALTGSVGETHPVGYGLNLTTDDTRNDAVWAANLQTRLPYANASGSASSSRQYWQGAAALQGAVVAHRSGVTLGPYVGDTFALIDAPGAKGAQVMDGQGARVDRFGYALVPSLLPYHDNRIALDPQGMNSNVELDEGQQHVVPYAGAMVRLHFKTVRGQAVLVRFQRPDGSIIPMGAPVLDEKGKDIGMVGQANQVYLRSERPQGELTVRWGRGATQQCRIAYQLAQDDDLPLQLLDAPCR